MKPELLQKGDQVALVAPARKITREEIACALQVIQSWGLNIVDDLSLFNAFHQFGGTDLERIDAFQSALDNPSIKAIFCVRGGYGITRIIDKIDFSQFRSKPKWICGYSDVTALLCHISNFDIESVHSTMPMLFSGDTFESIDSLRKILFGEEYHVVSKPSPFNRYGNAKGKIIGGNLSIINTIIATSSDVNTNSCILFLEDIDEYLYNIDRMIVHLKRAGKLDNISGLIVGQMTDMRDNTIPFGSSAYEIINNWTINLNIPVCFDFPVGHERINLAIPVNRCSNLSIDSKGAILTFN